MTPDVASTDAPRPAPRVQVGPKWWREVLYVVLFYCVYTFVRNLNGSVLSVEKAGHNAHTIVSIERALMMFHERQIQDFFIHQYWFIKFLNVYYGTAHFFVTIGVLLWLFHIQKERYRQWRNVIFATTGLALVGYVFFPLTPPRLLDPSYGFVDTLKTVGGLWNFESGAVAKASNQHAAMPSLHVGWSLWCAAAIMPVLRHAWSRVLIALYPALTITTIIVTANHYWADVFGGALIFGCGYLAALAYEKRAVRAVGSANESDVVVIPKNGQATDSPQSGSSVERDERRAL